MAQAQRGESLAYYRRAVKDKAQLAFLLPYLCGCVFTLACKGGLPPERGAAISGYYMTKIADMTSVEAFAACVDELQLAFAREVRRYQRLHTDCALVNQCLAYIDSHIEQPFQLNSLAQACGYSTSRIQHLFPQYTGMTVTAYVRREKIERAKFLLKCTDLSCSAVGQRLSFCSQSYFIQIFKQETGIAPAAYRRAAMADLGQSWSNAQNATKPGKPV